MTKRNVINKRKLVSDLRKVLLAHGVQPLFSWLNIKHNSTGLRPPRDKGAYTVYFDCDFIPKKK